MKKVTFAALSLMTLVACNSNTTGTQPATGCDTCTVKVDSANVSDTVTATPVDSTAKVDSVR
ncbi:hypothetical protein UFOVP449_43 [uncultured Caudovirales phage]|uniref:Uncharacterized protein n=1 Tax=uncultured Caudovirales phage TaxID=2100421 RepID=A0A6J5MAL9_9CAUD|nr:hypothetical protein UFOVP449_43 [uncultured Caudovirales phage]